MYIYNFVVCFFFFSFLLFSSCGKKRGGVGHWKTKTFGVYKTKRKREKGQNKNQKKRCRRRMQQRESCYADVVVSSCCFFSSEMMAVVLRRIVVLGVEGHRIGRRPMHHSRCRRRSSVHHVAHTATIRTVSAARASWIQSHCQNHNRQMQSVFN